MRTDVAKIEQALLAKALRGELAPSDPDDETVEALLQRILAAKTKLETGPEARRKITRKIVDKICVSDTAIE